MSDLISRQAILNEIENKNSHYEAIITIEDDDTTKEVIDKTLKAYRTILKTMISMQPIAYDVDKVVEKIKESVKEECACRLECEECLINSSCGILDAIKIVRVGGMNDK